MTNAEIGLFIFAGLIAVLVWYVDTHGEKKKPRYKRGRRRA